MNNGFLYNKQSAIIIQKKNLHSKQTNSTSRSQTNYSYLWPDYKTSRSNLGETYFSSSSSSSYLNGIDLILNSMLTSDIATENKQEDFFYQQHSFSEQESLCSPCNDSVSLIMRAPVSYRTNANANHHVPSNNQISHHQHPQQQQQPTTTAHKQSLGQTSCPPPTAPGGQRMALKLSSLPPATSKQVIPQTTDQCNKQRWSQPAVYNSNQTNVPCNTMDVECDDSDCSCSNSLECLSQQQQQHISQHHHIDSPHHSYPLGGAHNKQLHQHHPAQHHQQQSRHHHHHHHHHHQHHQLLDSTADEADPFLHHSQQQTFHHRPLVANSSVPPLHTGSSISPPPPPPPPPLVRQSTYTATPDTITDTNLMGPYQASDQAQDRQLSLDNWQASNQQHFHAATLGRLDSVGRNAANGAGAHQKHQKSRQTVSFRRSATADHHSTGDLTGANNSLYCDADDTPLFYGSSNNGHRSNSQLFNIKKHDNRKRQQANGSVNNTNDNPTADRQPNNQFKPSNNIQHHAARPPSPLMESSNHLHSDHHQSGLTHNATYPPATPLANRIHSAHLLPAGFPNTAPFDALSMPAITSHRTYSRWMRISSCVLIPISIIIILFIVVSPLLHYLL